MTSSNYLGSLLDAETFAAKRGCNPESLATLCAADRIFAVVVDGAPVYPAFYVDTRFKLAEVESITKLLRGLPSGSKWQFFANPKGSLGAMTPLEALLLGRFESVQATAMAFAER